MHGRRIGSKMSEHALMGGSTIKATAPPGESRLGRGAAAADPSSRQGGRLLASNRGGAGRGAAAAVAAPDARRQQQANDLGASARELRALLPRMWRHFRGNGASEADAVTANGGATSWGSSSSSTASSGATAMDAVVVAPRSLKEWLGSLNSSCSRWAKASDAKLRRVLQATAKLPRFRQRLGVRFKDPSKDGTWSVENLHGCAVSRKRPRGSDVAWDYYTAAFSLKVSTAQDDVMLLRRAVERKVISARVELRRRPTEPGGPLPKIHEKFTVTATSRCRLAQDRRKKIKVVRRALDLLPAVTFRPLSPASPQRWTLIYLHGLGSSALGNYADRPHYFMDGSVAVKVVIPTAPSRELSCYDGWWVPVRERKAPAPAAKAAVAGRPSRPRHRLCLFRSWYDYLSNHDGRREDSISFQSLGEIQRALHSLIQREAAELGGRTDRIIVGGKSQGCCTALDATLTFPQPLGGFIGIVGHLLGCTPVEPDGPQVNTPLHFFHEPEDHLMRWEWVQEGEQRLREAGYRVRARHQSDPEGHGHFVEGVEGAWVRAALRLICSAQ